MGHSLCARLESNFGEAQVVLQVECSSPTGSSCHLVCPEGCERWSLVDHAHALVDAGKCNAAEFIEVSERGGVCCYAGTTTSSLPLHDGAAVIVEWEGDYYSWRLAADLTDAPAGGAT